MTELLKRAFDAASQLAPPEQDAIARLVLEMSGSAENVIELTPEEEASFAESLAQSARGEFATDEEVRAVWAKHGL